MIGVVLKNIPKVLLTAKYTNYCPRTLDALINFILTLQLIFYRLPGKVKLGCLRCVLSIIFKSILYGASFLMTDHDNWPRSVLFVGGDSVKSAGIKR
jgi:hypothetical protein